MLQPVTTWPSVVSSAAPTLNEENAACAFSRAVRAALTRSAVPAVSCRRRATTRRSMPLRRSTPVGLPTSFCRRSKPARRSASTRVRRSSTARRSGSARRTPLTIGVTFLGGAGISPVTHRVVAPRLRFVADHLAATVVLAREQRRELRGERLELAFAPLVDVDQRDRQPAVVRAAQRSPPAAR